MVETTTRQPLIGSSLEKVDGVDKVTGRARFGADQRLPGMLQGAILRSPHPHANILGIDTSAAEALPGVHAVITAADFPELGPGTTVRFGAMSMDYYRMSRMIMAREKALYAGHPVAAVAATSRAIAKRALDLIDVRYEVLPHVLDEVEAMAPDAPLLHDDLFPSGLGERPARPGNVALELEMGHGDAAAGEAAADEIVERSFKTETVHQGYIEPEAETAWWRADGRITAWVDTQGIFSQRAQLAAFLGVPAGSIEVVPMEVGGGFGAKNTMRISPLCAGLSRKAGRPVQIVLGRDEVLRATGPGVKTTTAVRIGARRDGTITLIDARMVYNAGAFPGSPLPGGALVGLGPYQTDNLRLIGFDVVTNRPKGAAYRAPGGTPFTFAIESVIDELADRLGIDRLEFRKKNASKTGDPMPNEVIFNAIGLEEVLRRVGESPAWNDPLPEPVSGGRVGRGLALGFWRGGAGTSSCVLEVQMDGSIAVVTGSVDLHLSRTAMTNIVADQFQLPPHMVRVQTGTTDTVGYTDNSGGSRVTRTTGAAVYNACQAALVILRERAAEALDVTADVIEYAEGVFTARDLPDRAVTLADLAAATSRGAGVIGVTGTASGLAPAPAFAAHVADVEVDLATGKVDILRYTAFQDVGKAIHRAGVEGQIQGGAAQGAGWAVSEAYAYGDDGTLMNASLLDYRMPTALDLPRLDVEIIEAPSDVGPFGARGVAEVPIVPPAGAIANAIADATGVRMDRLPMSPENVFEATRPGYQRPDWLSMDIARAG